MTTARHVLTKLFHLTLLILLLQSTFAQKSTPARRRRQKSKEGVIFPETFKTVMKYLVVSLFGPVILYFIYSVVRDPVTPHLCWELSMRCREKLSGNVGEATTRDTTYTAPGPQPDKYIMDSRSRGLAGLTLAQALSRHGV